MNANQQDRCIDRQEKIQKKQRKRWHKGNRERNGAVFAQSSFQRLTLAAARDARGSSQMIRADMAAIAAVLEIRLKIDFATVGRNAIAVAISTGTRTHRTVTSAANRCRIRVGRASGAARAAVAGIRQSVGTD